MELILFTLLGTGDSDGFFTDVTVVVTEDIIVAVVGVNTLSASVTDPFALHAEESFFTFGLKVNAYIIIENPNY